MSLVNAVRVVHQGGRVWVVNNPSIALYGRRERSLPISDMLTYEQAVEIGAQYLDGRTIPDVSWDTIVAPSGFFNDDFRVGDWIELSSGPAKLQIVSLKAQLNKDNGTLQPVQPELVSRRRQTMLDADAAFDRYLRERGDGAPQATSFPSRIDTPSGAFTDVVFEVGSWYDGGPKQSTPAPVEILDDDDHWVRYVVEDPCRMWLWAVDADNTYATGTSVFKLYKNGVEWDSLFTISVGPSETFKMVQLWAHSRLAKGDVITIRCTQNGNHHQGKWGFRLTELS